MNLVFGQRERKEIGARTKRAMEEMALEKIHPSKSPYGYIRNNETGHLEVESIEAQVVKEIFELCKEGKSIRSIAKVMRDKNSYLKQGKWISDRVYKILTNSIYIGIFEYGKYKRKPQDVLRVKDYCEPIIDEKTWKETRKVLEKNKHSNYGQYVHLFTGIVKCPSCGKILSSSMSLKNKGKPTHKVYYFLVCKNQDCKLKGVHYSCEKIENKISRFLDELTRYIYDMNNEIMTCSLTKNKDIENIEKAINKLKSQEKRLVDLYLSSSINVDAINQKNDMIKKEIENLNKKLKELNPEGDFKEYTLELSRKLDFTIGVDENILKLNKFDFYYMWNDLNERDKKEIIQRLISSIEIKRDTDYEIEVTNIKFSEEFISKNTNEYLKYLMSFLRKVS